MLTMLLGLPYPIEISQTALRCSDSSFVGVFEVQQMIGPCPNHIVCA